jgi:hypothetical protein
MFVYSVENSVSNEYTNNEGQECETGPVWRRILLGGETERVKEDKYSQCTLYTCIKIQH